MKKPYRHYERSVSPEEFFSDDEANEYPRSKHDSRKQLKFPNRNVDSERELSRRRQKLAGRDASKENRYLSDDTRKSNHRHHRSVTEDRHRVQFSPSPSGYTKRPGRLRERFFSRDECCSDSEDEENESPIRRYDSGKQAKATDHKADSNYELVCKFLKFTGRDSSKGNDIPDKDVRPKSK